MSKLSLLKSAAACAVALTLLACGNERLSAPPSHSTSTSQNELVQTDLTANLSPDGGTNYFQATLPPATVTGTISQTLEATWDAALHSPKVAPVYPQGWSIDYYAGGTKLASAPTTATGWAQVSRVVTTGSASVEGLDGERQALSSSITAPPVVVASTFSGGSAGDGWDVFFDPAYTRVFNIHHHSSPATLMCRNLADSTTCPGYPIALTQTSNRATGRIDEMSNTLWMPTVTTSSKLAWDCVDLTTNTRCPTPVVLSSLSALNTAYDNHTDPVVIGRKLYALGYAAGSTTRITCLDMASRTECPSITLPQNGTPANAGLTAVGNSLYVLPGQNLNLDCYDATTGLRCAGSWPKAATRGPVWGVRSADSIVHNVCTENQCFALDGSATTLPPNFVAFLNANPVVALSYTYIQYGKGTSYGTKAAWTITGDRAACWDMATDAKCSAAFPISVQSMYAPTLDPQDPDCLWTNADTGIIRNFKMSTGVQGCSGGPPRISFKASVSIPRLGCDPSSRVYQYKSFKLVTPDPTLYTSATLTVKDSNGAPISGWINLPIPAATQTVDLTALSVAVAGDTPTFDVAAAGFTDTSLSPQAEFRVTTGSTPQLCWDLSVPALSCPNAAGLAGDAQPGPQSTTVTAKGSFAQSNGNVTPYTDVPMTATVNANPPNATNCGGTLKANVQLANGSPVAGVQVLLLDGSGNPVLDATGQPASALSDASGMASFSVWATSYKLQVGTSAHFEPSSMTVTAGGTGTTTASSGTVTSNAVSATVGGTSSVNAVVSVIPPAAPVLTAPVDGALLGTSAPAFSGTCVDGAQVTVFEASATVCSAACTGGVFSCAASALANGSHTVFATQNDGYAVSANSASVTFAVDTVAPAAPALLTPANGALSHSSGATFSGTCEPGASVSVVESGTVLCSATCSAASEFSCTVSNLAEGAHAVLARQTDAAGNTSGDSAVSVFTIDLTPPSAPELSAPVDGAHLNVAQPAVSGTCESGAQVTVFEGNAVLCTAACVDGAFTCTSSALADGSHTVSARQTDAAGNVSADASAVSFIVDTTAPAAPAVSAPVSGAFLADTTPAVSGACESDATVTVSEGNTVLCTAACVNGEFTCDSATLLDGSHTLTATQADVAGNISAASVPVTFTVDTQAPAAPVVTSPVEGVHSGEAAQVVSGTCETDAQVEVVENGTVLCSATCVNGAFTCTTPALADGSHAFVVRQTDAAGNVSSESDARNVIVDTVAPDAPAVTAPSAGAYTSDTTPALSGTCETDAQVSVFEGQTLLCQTPCTGGVFTCDSAQLADGSHTVTAQQTDLAGNVSAQGATRTFIVDSTMPEAPVLSAPTAPFTNDTTPEVSGTCETDSTVTVFDGTTQVCQAQCVAGAFTCTSSALTEGVHTLVATQTDQANNVSGQSGALMFTVDVTAPAAATLTAPAEGVSTTDATPLITGHCEPFAQVRVMEGQTELCSTTCLSTGLFVCQSQTLADGAHAVVADQTDRAGNAAPASAERHFSVDNAAPGAPAISAPAKDASLSDTTPVVSGTCETDAQVGVYEGQTLLCETACVGGQFSCTTSVLADGVHTVRAEQSDAAGNGSVQSEARSFRVDTVAPDAPVVTSPKQAEDVYTKDTAFSGTAEAGATVTVFVNGQAACTAVADDQGQWSCHAEVPAGAATVTASAKDAAGNTSAPSDTVAFNRRDDIDPTVITSQDGENGPEVKVSGTAQPGATVTVKDENGEVVCTATADEQGKWACSGELDAGPHTLTAGSEWNGFTQKSESKQTTVLVESAFRGGGCSSTGGSEPVLMVLAAMFGVVVLRRRRA